jgi:hypothetical protein
VVYTAATAAGESATTSAISLRFWYLMPAATPFALHPSPFALHPSPFTLRPINTLFSIFAYYKNWTICGIKILD